MRWQAAERLYAQAGANARFERVAGVGHDRKALQPLTTAFFKEILARDAAAAVANRAD